MKNSKGQEEMIGFALIIILVSVILLIFLGFSLNKNQEEEVKSGEVENFVSAVLTYTTECRDERNFEFLPIRKLIIDCSQERLCYDGENTCEILKRELKQIADKSWDSAKYIGYKLKLMEGNETLIPEISSGNISANKKGYQEEISDINVINVIFEVYS